MASQAAIVAGMRCGEIKKLRKNQLIRKEATYPPAIFPVPTMAQHPTTGLSH